MLDAVLVARHDDPHLPLIKKCMAARGSVLGVLPLGRPEDEYRVEITSSSAAVWHQQICFDSNELRKTHLIFLPFAVNKPPWVVSPDSFSEREWHAALRSVFDFWALSNGRGWLIAPTGLLLQDKKLFLLAEAARAGLQVPDWLVSTREAAIGLFSADKAQLVAKAINSWQQVSDGLYFNTTPIDSLLIREAAPFRTPAFLQTQIPHSVESRIYVAGRRVTQVVLTSSRTNVQDFRLLATEDPHAQVSVMRHVSSEISLRLQHLSRILGLKYCCFDVIHGEDGDWLVDVNPAGTWAYLNREFDVNITSDVIEGLLDE